MSGNKAKRRPRNALTAERVVRVRRSYIGRKRQIYMGFLGDSWAESG